MSLDNSELRGMASTDLNQALDAISMSRVIDRTQLVNQILETELNRISHEANLIVHMSRGNALLSELVADSRGNTHD
jgi:50S ribosomal subunit-associated GTPase HflX